MTRPGSQARMTGLRILSVVGVALLLSSCGGGPPESAVRDYFESEFSPGFLEIKTLQMDRHHFSSGGKDRYRVNFVGEAKVHGDYLELKNTVDWYREIPNARQAFPSVATPRVYRRTISAGDRVSIQGTCAGYREEGEWKFSAARLDFVDENGERISGNEASVWGRDLIIFGTPEFDAFAAEVVVREGE